MPRDCTLIFRSPLSASSPPFPISSASRGIDTKVVTSRYSSGVTKPPGPAVPFGTLTNTLPPGCWATRKASAGSIGGAPGVRINSSSIFRDFASTSSPTFSLVQDFQFPFSSNPSGGSFHASTTFAMEAGIAGMLSSTSSACSGSPSVVLRSMLPTESTKKSESRL
jgi:hypothetical protein